MDEALDQRRTQTIGQDRRHDQRHRHPNKLPLAGDNALPGDLITTGNPDSPEFQEKLKPGDVLKSEIEGIGAMTNGVAKAQ